MGKYVGVILLLLVVMYLAPQEEYKKYIQYFVGIIIAVLLFQPVFSFFDSSKTDSFFAEITQLQEKMSNAKYVEEGENIFEIYMDSTEEISDESFEN